MNYGLWLDTAVGCADVVPPRNVWWKRGSDGANATFGCTGQSLPVHRMTCVGNSWHSDTTPDSIDCPVEPKIGKSSLAFSTSCRFFVAAVTPFQLLSNFFVL